MNKERERSILDILLKEKKVLVKDLAQRLYASEPSIRRDLAALEKQMLLKRVHGGAILEENSNSALKIPFVLRELEQSEAKIIIAKKAAELVSDGDVILLDASSSAYRLVPFLSTKSNLTVITSGVKVLLELAEYGICTYSTGGKLLASCLSLVGEEAYQTISHYNADICFFSCRGLSLDGVATDFSIEENCVRQQMLKHSQKRVLLCDSKKVGKKYMHNLCGIQDIDFVLSETELPEPLAVKGIKNKESY